MANGDRNHVTVMIEEMLATARPSFTADCCIYKVPYEIRRLNEDAYTPQVVSIGPFHHGRTRLLEMEGHKRVYCQHFIDRSEASLDDLVSCVQELEPRVRRCYSGNIELCRDELVTLILVDCGFVIELFLRSEYIVGDDSFFSRPWWGNRLIWDLLLLENQLPFFVFDKLYSLAFASRSDYGGLPSFLQLTFAFYSYYSPRRVLQPPPSEIAHFTDLLRIFFLQPPERLPSREYEVLTLRHSASELNEAGVKFTVNKRSDSILDFEFSGRILEIPEITVEDSDEILLRNVVALEQYHYPRESYVTDYVQLLDCLINTEKDVDVLVKHGIIVNWLGDSNAVAELFNGLAKNITVTGSNANYRRICKDLTAYYENPWHQKRITYYGTLKRDYCNTPWKTVATIAAIVLLILTVIQTVCSILQVV